VPFVCDAPRRLSPITTAGNRESCVMRDIVGLASVILGARRVPCASARGLQFFGVATETRPFAGGLTALGVTARRSLAQVGAARSAETALAGCAFGT
jgi:hypothetical protein